MKAVLFYDVSAESLPKVMEHFPAHRARLEDFHQRGLLIAAGPLGNPPLKAMGIFSSLEAAKEFSEGDPFVLHGLVDKCEFLEWNALFL